jgi:transmembrane sensor
VGGLARLILEEGVRFGDTELDRSVTDPQDRRESIEATAAQWVIRLGGGPLSPDERRALDRWVAEHPDHRMAFDDASSTWADLGRLRDAPDSLAGDVVSPPSRAAARLRAPVRSRPRVWGQAGVLAAAVLLAVCLGIAWLGDPVTMLVADYRTAPAEIRTVALPDGSSVDLAPASAIALRFDDSERRIELLAGVAFVTAAPMTQSEGRPFVVEAANGAARALGTQFMVDRMPDAVRVLVTQHRVEVASISDAAKAPETVVLSPGQSVRYDRRTGLGPVQDANPEHATAWRRGRLVFDRVSLAEVVAELNRYRHGRIVVADAALGNRTVSGVFDAARLDEALASIVREIGVRTVSVPPFLTLLY